MANHIHTYELPDGAPYQDFQIFEVKGQKINKNYPHKTDRPHRHNYYEVCVFINGAGKHEIDFNTHLIHPNSIHFISPGQVHLISRDKDYHGYLIVFSREFYSLDTFHQDLLDSLPFFNNQTLLPVLDLDQDSFKELLQLINVIEKESRSGQLMTKEILRSYLQILLLKCRQFYFRRFAERVKMHDPHFAQVQHFNNLVEKKFSELHLVQEYAALMAISPATLNKHVKKITGYTAGEILMNRLILQAKRLLIYTDLSNKEIAFRLNYDDPSYFSRLFKKKVKMSPAAFRRVMKEKYQF